LIVIYNTLFVNCVFVLFDEENLNFHVFAGFTIFKQDFGATADFFLDFRRNFSKNVYFWTKHL